MKDYHVSCNSCKESWIAAFHVEFGFLVPYSEDGESCPECGSGDTEVGDAYEAPLRIQSFYVVLLVPSILIFAQAVSQCA